MATKSVTSLLQQVMTPDNINMLSGMLGADPKTTQNAVGTAVPALLAALGKEAATPQGASALNNALAKDHDGSILDDIAGYIAAGGDLTDGNKILGHLLGSNQQNVANGLGSVSGLGGQGMNALLAGLAPLVLGAIGKDKKEEGLDAGGLSQLLTSSSAAAKQESGVMETLNDLFDQNNDGSAIDDLLNMGSGLLGGLFGKK